MSFVFQPWQPCLVILASWINREQQAVIEYLMTENRVLKEKLGKGRILLNDDQRRRLAVKGKILGRKLLRQFGTLFTPDTILRWHRQLVAMKWDYDDRRKSTIGHRRLRSEIRPRKFDVGLRSHPRHLSQRRLPHHRHDCRQHSQGERKRTGAGPPTLDVMGHVPQIPLGRDSSD